MKRKNSDNLRINGYYVGKFTRGSMGEHEEGKNVSRCMGLSVDVVPYSVASLFQNGKMSWKDCGGSVVSISFHVKPDQMECCCE